MKLGDNGEAFFVQETEQNNVNFTHIIWIKLSWIIYRCSLYMYLFFSLKQEIVPAHLVTSPIPTEEPLFRSRESRCGGTTAETSQPLSLEEPVSVNLHPCSNSAGKKKKRRRRKHKAEPRKEEQTTSSAAGELELCDLSSDEEQNAHNGRWGDMFTLKIEIWPVLQCNWIIHLLFPVLRASSLSAMKENMDHRQHSPLTALEWDSYPFSDGDWSPCTMYGLFCFVHSDVYRVPTSRKIKHLHIKSDWAE